MFLQRVGKSQLLAAGGWELEFGSFFSHLQHATILGGFENVPARARRASDHVARRHGLGHRIAERDTP